MCDNKSSKRKTKGFPKMIKLFKTKKSAIGAVKKQGLHLITHEVKYMDAKESGYYVEFEVDNIDDVNEIRDRGFAAKLIKSKFADVKTFEDFLAKKDDLVKRIKEIGHTEESQKLGMELGELCFDADRKFPKEWSDHRRELAREIANENGE